MTELAASVIIPVGAIDPELDEQLVALAHQDLARPWELLLAVNTTARDGLDQMLARFVDLAGPDGPDVRVVDCAAVRSASHARNAGAGAARSDRLLFCDGDDIADKGWLDAMLRGLEVHGAVGGHLDETLLAVSGQEGWRPPATPDGNPRFLGHDYLVSANLGVRTELFHAVGGFDESLIRGEDIAFSWALTEAGTDIGYVPDAVIHYRHRRGLTPMIRQHILYGRGMSQVIARHGLPQGGSSRALFRPNSQPVERSGVVHVLRRASLAAGRLIGLVEEAIRTARTPRRRDSAIGEGG